MPDDLTGLGVIVNHQYGAAGHWLVDVSRRLLSDVGRFRCCVVCHLDIGKHGGKPDSKGRPYAQFAGDGYIATQHLAEASGDGQPQTSTAIIARG